MIYIALVTSIENFLKKHGTITLDYLNGLQEAVDNTNIDLTARRLQSDESDTRSDTPLLTESRQQKILDAQKEFITRNLDNLKRNPQLKDAFRLTDKTLPQEYRDEIDKILNDIKPVYVMSI